jgi:hypothetical protein
MKSAWVLIASSVRFLAHGPLAKTRALEAISAQAPF